MIRISDFYSLVKIFFKNIFSFKLSFKQQFKLFITKAFEILFRVYVKKVDDRFFYSDERKDRFKSKGFIKRTVTTAFGYVTFECRKYVVDKKTDVYYYIDEKIGLKRYRRLSEELIFTILFEYQHTAASFVAKTYGISKATVYNLVNSFEMPKLNIERFEKDDDSPVYMEIDEDHMKYRRREIHIWGWLYIVELRNSARTGSSSLSSRPKAFSRKKIKRKAMYHTFFANYGKDRDKAHKVYFNGARADTMEKVIETNCLADIISEVGKGTNIPYLRRGERLIREVLKEISQSRMI